MQCSTFLKLEALWKHVWYIFKLFYYFSTASFPSCVLELSDHEIKDWFSPRDFMVGQTLFILGRRLLLHDCDEFTKNYYRKTFGITDFTSVDVKGLPREPLPKVNIYLCSVRLYPHWTSDMYEILQPDKFSCISSDRGSIIF